MTSIELSGVGVSVGGGRLVSGIDLEVATGEVVGIVGPSGSGKTTLLRLMAGLTGATEGTVRFGGASSPPQGFVAMSLQADPMYTNRDVAGNLGFPLDMARSHTAADRADRIDRTARRMGVHRILERRSGQISGGERAAVSVGRALVGDRARFVLLDEPLAKADLRRREALRALLRSFGEERPDIGVVIASNDQNDLMGLADRVIVMHGGVIAQEGPPGDLYDRPADLRVAGFVGSPPMNLMPSVVDRWQGRFSAAIGTDHIDLDQSVAEEVVTEDLPGRPIVVGVRPENLVMAEPSTPFGRVLHATVGWVEEPTGVVWFGLGRVGAMAYALINRPGKRLEAGDRLELTWAPDKTRIFDAESGRAIPKSIVGSAD